MPAPLPSMTCASNRCEYSAAKTQACPTVAIVKFGRKHAPALALVSMRRLPESRKRRSRRHQMSRSKSSKPYALSIRRDLMRPYTSTSMECRPLSEWFTSPIDAWMHPCSKSFKAPRDDAEYAIVRVAGTAFASAEILLRQRADPSPSRFRPAQETQN